MSKQLYEEALADVKKLKEVAEDNAKRALIEAVSPRIKDLIENELLREIGEEKEDEEKDDLLLDKPNSSDESEGASDDKEEDVEEGYALNNESAKSLSPILEQLSTAAKIQIESRLFNVQESAEKFLNASAILKNTPSFKKKVSDLISEIENVYGYLQESAGTLRGNDIYEGKLEDLYKKLNKLVEQENMKNRKRYLKEADVTLKLTGLPDEVDLESLGVDLISDEEGDEGEEAEGGDEEVDLGGDEGAEAESGDEGGDEELDLGGDEGDEEKPEEAPMESRRLSDNLVVEIDEGMLRREISRMRSLREADETKPQSWGHGPGKVSSEEDFEADDLGDPFVDIDLTTESQEVDEVDQVDEQDHVDEVDQVVELDLDEMEVGQAVDRESGGSRSAGQSTSAGPGAGSSKRGRSPGTDVAEMQEESVRARLARETRVQTEAKKRATQAKQQQKKSQAKGKQAQVEAQQASKKKQGKQAQMKKQEAQKHAKQAKQMQEAYAYYANIFNESVRRTEKLRSVLAEASRRTGAVVNSTPTRSAGETDNLRKKLAETNLFNTKLLYSNKLLQNESLTKRQKAEIIERLDEASSEREVKLVYESLVKALSTTSRSISEGAQRPVVGSSSQATRPASTVLSEGYEADRWAKLAGLK